MKPGKLPYEASSIQMYNDDNLINIKEFFFQEENQNEVYYIKLGLTNNKSNLIIKSYKKDNYQNNCFQLQLNYNEFLTISKGFKMCESLEEINEILQEIFESKKVKITKEYNTLIISLYIILLGGKEQKIDFILGKNDYNCKSNESNIELYKKVNYFEKEIKYLKKIISQQSQEIEELKKWKIKYDNEIQCISKNKNHEVILNNIDSKIFKSKEEIEFIDKRLKNNDKILMDKTIKFKLLYRASKDGNSEQSFHNKCDDIRGTLTVIKTTKGIRFGGYTEQTWNYSNGGKTDRKGIAFCYSLDLFKIYNHINGCSICCLSNYGPYFNYIFYITFPLNRTEYEIQKNINNTFEKFEKDYEINYYQRFFSVQELEIFQILFD